MSEALELKTGSYWSDVLGQNRPYAYVLPEATEANRNDGVALYVLLHGLNGNYLDWPTHTRLARYAADAGVCVALFDGGNGWYTDAADGSGAYEHSLVHEFVPHLRAHLPLRPPGAGWAIGGASMGGYGAIKTALRRPDLFMLGVSHAGAFDESRRAGPHPVFGDPDRDRARRRAANVYALAEDALCRFPVERPRLYLDCGTKDPLIESSRRFHDHLNFIGYAHHYAEIPGHHTWPTFDRALRTALPTVAEMLLRSVER
jgi:S-formylglutathione hydrolase FrmB